jgi:hypothetical protein
MTNESRMANGPETKDERQSREGRQMKLDQRQSDDRSDWLAVQIPGFRFSIRAMLVTLTIATLLVSHTYTGWQLHQAREEIRLLRQGIDRRVEQRGERLTIPNIVRSNQ